MPGILDGIRVLDFGRFVAGPYCAALLAELGADVIRIERPGGGDDRFLMPATSEGEGAQYLHCNRAKRALTLDSSTPEGREVMRRLIAGADVVIANFSPQALRHFGLDCASVRAIREDIVLTTVSAFGSEGPLKDAVGYDGVGQAVSGALYLTGEPGHPYRSATSYVDFSTALASAYGTLAAIIHRMKTGEGMHVEASLAGTALTIMNPILIEQATGANVRQASGNRSPIAGPSDVFRASDGWFIMQVVGQAMFRRWTRLVNRPDLLEDPRLADDIGRGRHGGELSAIMQGWIGERTVAECLADLEVGNLAGSPVLSPAQVVGNELGLADAFFETVAYPGTDGIPLVKPPVRLSSAPAQTRRAPLVGEHSQEVLRDFGFSAEEIGQLSATGVI